MDMGLGGDQLPSMADTGMGDAGLDAGSDFDSDMPPADDAFGATDSAVGGQEELGRERR